MPKRACLSGKDIADLIEGRVISAFGVEFAYDGLDIHAVQKAMDELKARTAQEQPSRGPKAKCTTPS